MITESSELGSGEEAESSLLEVEGSEEEDEDRLEVDEDPELELVSALARCKAFRPWGWICLVKTKSDCELESDSVESSSSPERPEEEVESGLRLETSVAWLSASRALSIDSVEDPEDEESVSLSMLEALLNAS